MTAADVMCCEKDIASSDLKPEYVKLDNHSNNDNMNSNITVLSAKSIGTDPNFKREIVWSNAIGFLIMHSLAFVGLIIMLTGGVSFYTFVYNFFMIALISQGVTIGAHRLYTHKTFKAKLPLRAYLLIWQTISGQNCMYIWVRDHRLHHRYSDTDADPHNAKRGFFFSHIGWLMSKKHPYVLELQKKIDMSDLEEDKLVMFQKKYYYELYFLLAFLLPVWIPVHFFGDSWVNSIFVSYFLRYITLLNGTWLVNSAAHIYGTRPYDKTIQPVQNTFVSFIGQGEGWHNYHHAFPWDYNAAELGTQYNFSGTMIRFYERIGLAYDLKTASSEMVTKRILKNGDGTHEVLGNNEAKASVTAVGFVHPLNITYTTTFEPPVMDLRKEGLPLYHEKDFFNMEEVFRKRKIGSN